MIARLALLCGSFIPMTVCGQASVLDASHVVHIPYREGEIVSLTGHTGYALDIELQRGEKVINIASGNIAALDIGVEGHHLFVKPKRATEQMNLIVLTDHHTYRFDYRVQISRGTDHAEVVYAVIFEYPPPPAPAVQTAAAPVWNTNYWFCGASDLRPTEAFDDGIRTYLRFDPNTEFPATYLAEADGQERLVNAHAVGEWIIVHQISRRLALRRGGLAGCVENRSWLQERVSKREEKDGSQ